MKIFCLMGPTASGKTALALKLTEHFPMEIISVDSAMIYKGMDIGTAKPSAEELKKAPHHLIDILNPDQRYSAAHFIRDVEILSSDIQKRGKIPLLVGGTMMYFQALQKGLSPLPEANEKIREKLSVKLKEEGLATLYADLVACDPNTASRIHDNDTQRILRALEVYELTGKSKSELLKAEKNPVVEKYLNIGLFPEDRSWLHAGINQRFDKMLAEGLIEEVKSLQNTWNLDDTYPSMRTVGYRQVLDWLSEGKEDLQNLKEKGKAATRQLAKRQLTWLRSFSPLYRIDPSERGFETEIIQWITRVC